MAKPALNRQTFIDAALTLIHSQGVDKLSMRKVADQLDVSAMAMYKHFSNKEELLSAALDCFIARAEVLPSEPLPWQQWVEYVAYHMFTALADNAFWVPLLGSLQLGAQAATVTDAFVARLEQDGFTTEQAVQAYFAVIQQVIGAVCLHTSIHKDALPPELSKPSKNRALEEQRKAGTNNARHTPSAGALAPTTLSYLENANQQRLRVAPVLDNAVAAHQLSQGLPLIIAALGSLQTK